MHRDQVGPVGFHYMAPFTTNRNGWARFRVSMITHRYPLICEFLCPFFLSPRTKHLPKSTLKMRFTTFPCESRPIQCLLPSTSTLRNRLEGSETKPVAAKGQDDQALQMDTLKYSQFGWLLVAKLNT